VLASHPARGLVALATSLLLGLGGCGDGAEDPELIDRNLITLMPEETPDEPGGDRRTPPASPTGVPTAWSRLTSATGSTEPGDVAARAARDAVRGGTVTVAERTDSGWEVTLVGRGGRETVVAENEGGPSVVRRLSVGEAEDRAEAVRLARGARLDVGQAIARARTLVPVATVIKVELDEDDGVIRYELDFDDEDDVLVDAVTGTLSRDD
jgi:hypothetical protein